MGKEMYTRRMLPKRIVIIGWMSLNNRNNASVNIINGTIL
jgi:hypothetical protein